METDAVTTVKLTLVVPARTVTVLGMDAMAEAPLTMERVTTVSFATAVEKVTLPVLFCPPTTEFGVKVKPESVFTFTVSVPVLLPPLAAAEI